MLSLLARCTYPIISTARVNRFYTSSTPTSKFSIGVARIFTLSREIRRVWRSARESKFAKNSDNFEFLTNFFISAANLDCGLTATWTKVDRRAVARIQTKHWRRKKISSSRRSSVGRSSKQWWNHHIHSFLKFKQQTWKKYHENFLLCDFKAPKESKRAIKRRKKCLRSWRKREKIVE